ncbi:MAG TPA: hypothetical protein VEF04_23545 [Blastocatellia bacterium]|nr:hypothetical protein [Blastocatellia bacterium]
MITRSKAKIRRWTIMSCNTLADVLAMLDRYVFRCRWRWLCLLPGRLWSPDLSED